MANSLALIPGTRIVDLKNNRYGRLAPLRAFKKDGVTRWECRCDCGTIKVIRAPDLVNGKTVSCGCYNREVAAKRQWKHGLRADKPNTPAIYRCWLNMSDRCRNPNNKHFRNYGGKGIQVCKRWKNFKNFYADMFPTWMPGLTIERLDNNLGYRKSNCVWATQKVQANHTSRNRLLTIKGVTKTIAQWADVSGLPQDKIRARINTGWHEDHILNPSDFTGRNPFRLGFYDRAKTT